MMQSSRPLWAVSNLNDSGENNNVTVITGSRMETVFMTDNAATDPNCITLLGNYHNVLRSRRYKIITFHKQACWGLYSLGHSLQSQNLKPIQKTADWSSSINHSQLESANGLALIQTSWWHAAEDGNILWTHLPHIIQTGSNVIREVGEVGVIYYATYESLRSGKISSVFFGWTLAVTSVGKLLTRDSLEPENVNRGRPLG